jgi:hypothetical protein
VARGAVSIQEVPRPLHRLTPLHDDPASGWLSPAAQRTIETLGWLAWSAYVLALFALFALVQGAFYGPLYFLQSGIQYALILTIAVSTAPAMRQAVVRLKHRRLRRLVTETVAAEALRIDDWGTLEGEPDGRVVSLVGRVRAGARLATPLGGEPCIGIALGCTQTYPGVLESGHDFALVDEHGRSIPIRVADGRLFGPPNARIFGDREGRLLVASLDLPAGATPTRDAFVVRDGDPLRVVGVKTTFVDPTQPGMRQAPLRIAITSSGTRPLLVYPGGSTHDGVVSR